MRLLVAVLVVTAVLVGGCGTRTEPLAEVSGRVVAGPVCPVETDPPDPNCAPRPVAGAQIRFETAAGEELVATTDDDGGFRIEIPIGRSLVVPLPVEGLLGTPQPLEAEFTDAGLDLGTIEYDTGIR